MSQGDFCWFDLMSTDVPAARVFYTALFGWSVTSHNPEYAMIQDRHGRTLGGMMAAAPGMPSAWLAYVTVDDLDDTLRKVKDAGGRVFMSHEVPAVGRFAIFGDPQGAVIAALQHAAPVGPYPREKGESHLCWSELHTQDPDAALAFYVAVFGWAHESWGPDYHLVGSEHAGGIVRGQPGVPPHWLVYANVTDADVCVDQVQALGGSVVVPATQLANVGRFAVFRDPTGGVFAVMQNVARPA